MRTQAAAAVVFDVQRVFPNGERGMRTVVFLKGCPLRCAWCDQPESLRGRLEPAFDAQRCQRSFACREVCPEQAILHGPAKRIDPMRCTGCGKCVGACASGAMRLIGRRRRLGSLLRELERDRDNRGEGGDVVFSGGEPMSQAAFLTAAVPALAARGFGVGLETCGLFRWAQIRPLLPALDYLFFDLKLMDPAAHRRYTGQGNRQILDNFARLARGFPGLQARMPVVPGVNDDETNLRRTAAFLRTHGQRTIHCLRYHRLDHARLARLTTTRRPLDLPPQTDEDLERVARTFAEHGIEAITDE